MATAKQQGTQVRITAEHVRLFKLAMAIREAGEDEEWEEAGGRRREFLNVSGELHDLLGLALWDLPVTSECVERDAVSWPVRQALEAAMAQEAAGRASDAAAWRVMAKFRGQT
jgi:hypothetical protein